MGAWQQDANGNWSWDQSGTPDPGLVSQWGYGAITDIRQDPTGTRNHGAWTPQHGGGWHWTWGVNPDPDLIASHGYDELTDPDHIPGHGHGSTDANQPPPPDVQPPTLTDSWHGIPPDVTGAVPVPLDGANGPTVTSPPTHQSYKVAPGSIRGAENVTLANIDFVTADYDSLKAQVAAAKTQYAYDARHREELVNYQDRMLLEVGDALHLAGQFVAALNNAAQMYARADLDSFVPET